MSDAVIVIGSGASGVHFAQTLIERGRRVLMLDIGRVRPPPVAPTSTLDELKRTLDDPAAYFLGERHQALVLPASDEEYYGFPPSKDYVFEPLEGQRTDARGFAPLESFATGGLAQAWTGGSYPFHDAELAGWPISYDDLGPRYDTVARRIGISGMEDDLAPFFPVHDGLQPPIGLDEHGSRLMRAYEKKRENLRRRLGTRMGRARLAALSQPHDGRPECSNLGRCLWGCPTHALYTPAVTLGQLQTHENFTYVRGVAVTELALSDGGRVTRVVAREIDGGAERTFEGDTVALAAGALGSARILLASLHRAAGDAPELGGLMDNRQVLMPFVNLGMLGRRFEPDSYQYHQLAIGVEGRTHRDYVHGLVTTLKTALIHPLVQSLPTSLGIGARAFGRLHAALGLVNVNFSDHRRDGNRVAYDAERDTLVVSYAPDADEPARIARATSTLRTFLRALGCIAPKGMTRMRPMGASVHYAGCIPMAESGGELTSTPDGRWRGAENLYLVDGITFPELPAKNLTFTLMANATRIAEEAF